MVNAGLETHAPMLLGAHMTLIAEDGNPYPYRAQQYLATLPAGKTMDATLTVPAAGQAYPLFDRRLRLANANTASSASGMISILRAGGAPIVGDDAVTTAEDTAATIAVLANDVDPDGGTLTVTSISLPSNGTAVINPDNTITYTPGANLSGTDTFTYLVRDPSGAGASATVTVTVTPVNDAPVAADDSYTLTTLTAAGNYYIPATTGVLANDTDAEGDAKTAVLVTNVGQGTLSLYGQGGFNYTPPAGGVTGPVTFTYRARDSQGALGNIATVTLVVQL
jgi:hypothetical protein